MSSAYNKKLLREHANSELPEELALDYRRELTELAERVRLNFEQRTKVNGNGISRSEVAQQVLTTWIKEKELCMQYGRYSDLMRSQGRLPLQKPEYVHKYRGVSSVINRFKYIESADIKIGSKVRRKDGYTRITYEVIGISVDCKLIFKQRNGRRMSTQEPTIYEVVK